MAFSVFVEALNLRVRRKTAPVDPVHLHEPMSVEDPASVGVP